MRRQDWPVRLAAFLDARRGTPFAYGSHDCVLMAADWIVEATGEDPIAEIRGSWNDIREALRLSEDLRDQVTRRLGAEIGPQFARRGDIVLHEETDRPGLGICVGEKFAAPLTAGGIVLLPMLRAVCAWRV